MPRSRIGDVEPVRQLLPFVRRLTLSDPDLSVHSTSMLARVPAGRRGMSGLRFRALDHLFDLRLRASEEVDFTEKDAWHSGGLRTD